MHWVNGLGGKRVAEIVSGWERTSGLLSRELIKLSLSVVDGLAH